MSHAKILGGGGGGQKHPFEINHLLEMSGMEYCTS